MGLNKNLYAGYPRVSSIEKSAVAGAQVLDALETVASQEPLTLDEVQMLARAETSAHSELHEWAREKMDEERAKLEALADTRRTLNIPAQSNVVPATEQTSETFERFVE